MNAKEWKEKLYLHKKNGGLVLSEEELQKAQDFCQEYKNFLNCSKTEREAVHYAVARAEAQGFVPFDPNTAYKAGDKVYLNNRGKALILAVVGKNCLCDGVHILAAHTDSPRLDLKQVPVYEDGEMAYFKTHYYGGIKKYQWVTTPLSLHGVLVKNDGTTVTVRVGEDEGDPGVLRHRSAAPPGRGPDEAPGGGAHPGRGAEPGGRLSAFPGRRGQRAGQAEPSEDPF